MPVDLFDANFYRAANPDLVGLNDAQALSHFLTSGLDEGRAFSPFADLNFYRSSNPNLASFNNQQAYEHLRNFGVAEGRHFSPFVDLNFYRAGNGDLAGFNNEQIFEHLRNFGLSEGRQFSQFFNINYYRASNPDLVAARLNNSQLLQHFEINGLNKGRLFSVPFDVNYYRSVNSDLAAAGLNNQQLYDHFQLNGLSEGGPSSPFFNVSYYLANNSDLRARGFNNFQAYDHFVLFGLQTGRLASGLTGSDYAGNAFNTVRNIAVEDISTIFRDFVGNTDTTDLYRFSLNTTSNASLLLNGLSGDANVQLLNSNGAVIQSSSNSSIVAESISRILDPGNYYIQVYPSDSSANTNYNLNLTVRSTSSFDIQFDYRFDTNGFFNDPNRRATLSAAATIWETILRDEFADVPVGTATPHLTNPQTGANAGINNIFTTDVPIDDLVVFVGARELGSSTLAWGGPSGWYTDETRYTSSNFEPWAGTIAFDTSTQWFFDTTPNTSIDIPTTSVDFLSTAVHELGHVLGILSEVNAFKNLTSGGYFNGPNAKALNGGSPIPLDSWGHVKDGFVISGIGSQIVMDASINHGVRELPTPLDIALLADIGYQVAVG